MINLEAVMGREMPKERRRRSTGQIAKAQIRRDEKTRAKSSVAREERRNPPIKEPSSGMTFSETLDGNGCSSLAIKLIV